MARQFVLAQRVQRSAMDRQDEFTLGVVTQFHQRSWDMTSNRQLQAFVQARGLLPFFQDAESAVKAEILAIQRQLGISRDEAIAFMRSKIPTPQEETVMNGAQAPQGFGGER